MAGVERLVFWEATILLGGFAALILWKLLTGGIRLNLLLQGDTADGRTSFSPGRAQLLMTTLLVAMQFLLQVSGNPTKFPRIPLFWIIALGGSQAVYLGAKAWSLLGGGKGPRRSGD